MPRFERRLRNLEARLTDCSGLVPDTTAWWDYWTIRIDQLCAGEKPDVLITLEVFDAFLRLADAHHSGSDPTERNRPDDEGNQQTACEP